MWFSSGVVRSSANREQCWLPTDEWEGRPFGRWRWGEFEACDDNREKTSSLSSTRLTPCPSSYRPSSLGKTGQTFSMTSHCPYSHWKYHRHKIETGHIANSHLWQHTTTHNHVQTLTRLLKINIQDSLLKGKCNANEPLSCIAVNCRDAILFYWNCCSYVVWSKIK